MYTLYLVWLCEAACSWRHGVKEFCHAQSGEQLWWILARWHSSAKLARSCRSNFFPQASVRFLHVGMRVLVAAWSCSSSYLLPDDFGHFSMLVLIWACSCYSPMFPRVKFGIIACLCQSQHVHAVGSLFSPWCFCKHMHASANHGTVVQQAYCSLVDFCRLALSCGVVHARATKLIMSQAIIMAWSCPRSCCTPRLRKLHLPVSFYNAAFVY